MAIADAGLPLNLVSRRDVRVPPSLGHSPRRRPRSVRFVAPRMFLELGTVERLPLVCRLSSSAGHQRIARPDARPPLDVSALYGRHDVACGQVEAGQPVGPHPRSLALSLGAPKRCIADARGSLDLIEQVM